MIRKSEYFEQTDKYLNSELTLPELNEFETQMGIDFDLAEEVNLHLDVEQAMCEQDIVSLRSNLGQIVQGQTESAYIENIGVFDSFSFGLSEELSTYQNMGRPVETGDLFNLRFSFPKIHLYQHKIAGKENIHQFYKEQPGQDAATGQEPFSPFDEDIFNGVQSALEEPDIADIRANLGQIARNAPEHHYSAEEIDDFIAGRMEPEAQSRLEEELAFNSALDMDVRLSREAELAWAESGIMQLRASLAQISKAQLSTAARIEEIEGYLYNELPEDKMAAFEAGLSSNQGLAEEMNLVKETDRALQESDIMRLRSNLQGIAGDIAAQKQGQRSFAAKTVARKILVSSVAASLVLALGIAGLLSRQPSSGEIYRKFYSTYQTAGISRSAGTATDQTMALALQKYNSREYGAALDLLRQVLAGNPNHAAGHFYAGAAFQETGKYPNAIKEYETVITDKDNLFTEQARWYTALCYLRTGENKKAYAQLKGIAKNDGFYQLKAQAILKKIKYSE